MQAEVRQRADIRRLFQVLLQRFGRLDIVVNNAGTFLMKPVVDTSEEDYDSLFAVNTRGPFFALQEAARHLADGGRIVNISSGATALANAGLALYCCIVGARQPWSSLRKRWPTSWRGGGSP